MGTGSDRVSWDDGRKSAQVRWQHGKLMAAGGSDQAMRAGSDRKKGGGCRCAELQDFVTGKRPGRQILRS
ncbi:MAG: hypothetical protein IKC46_15865 [Lachnospiraceae bacterium]|nr:hypothetical protein [Lachnospiraceae bacterium]